MLYRDLGIGTLDDLERAAREGRLRDLKGMGAKKEAFILKALEERARVDRPPVDGRSARDRGRAPRGAPRARARRRHLAGRQPPARLRDVRRSRHPRRRRPADADGGVHRLQARRTRRWRTATPSRACCSGADSRPTCASSRARAWVRRFSTSPARSRTTLRSATARSSAASSSTNTGSSGTTTGCRWRARRKKTSTARSASPTSRRSCARTAARSRPPKRGALPRLLTLADLRGDLHMHTTATDGRADAETMALAARAAGLSLHRHHRSQPGARDG